MNGSPEGAEDDSGGDSARPPDGSWLHLPPAGPVPPPVTTRPQVLPVHQLTWEDFERLCLRLLRLTQEVEQVLTGGTATPVARAYGTRGQAQHGIDVYSRDPLPLDGSQSERSAVCLQARRIQKVTKTGLKNAVTDFLKGTWAPAARKFIYATSASGAGTQFVDEVEVQARRLARAEIELVVWDEEALSDLLRGHPELIDDFFGRAWVSEFCGSEAANGLARRLDGGQVTQLRREIRRIYRAAFSLADPGIVASGAGPNVGVPLAERFVTPDVHPLRIADAYPKGSQVSHAAEATPRDTDPEGLGASGTDSASLPSGPTRRAHGALHSDWLGSSGSASRSPEASRVSTNAADEWLSTAQKQVVIGEPGAGKSTLLRHLVLDLLSDEPVWTRVAERWGDRLPVWLPFHFFTQRVTGASGQQASVVQAIKAWFEQHDAGLAWPLVEKALDDRRLLLIVDGLDEWSQIEAGEYAVAALETFATTRSVALVVSTRPYGLQRLTLGPEWAYSKIASLSALQQRALARTYLAHGLREAGGSEGAVETALTGLMSEIETSSDLRAMAGVPLFLVLLVTLRLSTGGRLPIRRFEVFDRAIQLLVAEHPTRRRVAAAITLSRQGLRERQLRAVLADVAFQAQARGDLGAITEQHLRTDLIRALQDPDVLALGQKAAIEQADSIADVAEGDLGLLVRQGPSEVAFIHRCLQEQLAAEHITTRLAKDEQHELLLNRLGDVRWREVLLGVVWLTSRPDERREFAEALVSLVNDSPVGLQAAEVLAEVVFGPYDLPGGMSREQARFLADRIETHPQLTHRARLLSHFLTGIDSVGVQAIVEDRLAAWTGFVEPARTSLVSQLGLLATNRVAAAGPLKPTVKALAHLDPAIVWAAAEVLVRRLGTDDVSASDDLAYVRTEARAILASPTSAASVAGALAVVCSLWPGDEETNRAVQTYRSSVSDAVRMVALAHVVGGLPDMLLGQELSGTAAIDELTEGERTWLRDAISRSASWDTHDGISRIMIATAARFSPEALEHVLNRMEEGTGPDLASVWDVALSAFSEEPRVANLLAQQIREDERRPWPLLRLAFGRGRALLAFTPDHPHRELIAEAIEARLERFPSAREVFELHQLAAVRGGPRMRAALLSALTKSHSPHLAVGPLLDHFSDDPGVVASIREILDGDPVAAAGLGAFAGQALGPELGRERLLEILRALAESDQPAGRSRYGPVASGLVDCCQELADPSERETICAEALRLIPDEVGPWDEAVRFDLAVQFYPCPSAKEVLAQCAEEAGVKHLPGLLFAYRGDPASSAPLIDRADQLLRVPPPSIRYAIYDFLSTGIASPGLVIARCAEWAEEASEPVKSVASLAYHRALLAARVQGSLSDEDWANALEHLGTVAACYGPDHEARRRAAWVGMCVIGDWSPVDARFETIGAGRNLVGVTLDDPLLGPDEVLLDQLGNRWSELRDHFGAQLVPRLSGLRSDSEKSAAWANLATAAARFPALDADVRRAVEADPELLSGDAIVAWYVSDQRRSRPAATEMTARHVVAETNRRSTVVRLAQEPASVGLDTSRLRELLADRAAANGGYYGNAALETLAVLEPSHPLVQRAWTHIANLIQYSPRLDDGHEVPDGDDSETSASGRPFVHPETYLAVAYSCIPGKDIGWLVGRDLQWLVRGGDDLTWYEPALVLHLRRRLRTDPAAVASLRTAAADSDVHVHEAVQMISLLAAGAPTDAALRTLINDTLDRVAREQFAPLTRDLVIGATVSLQTSLLNAALVVR